MIFSDIWPLFMTLSDIWPLFMTFSDKISKIQLSMTFYDFMKEWKACWEPSELQCGQVRSKTKEL